MVKQNYNHPCVCFWGLFNELGNQISVSGQKAQHDDQVALIQRLNGIAPPARPRPADDGRHHARAH